MQIGPLAVHWYGVAYVVGILFAWWYAKRLAADTRLWPGGVSPMTPDDLDDFLVWAAVGVVAGGRIGYILFYDFARYLANPLDIFALWQGGMSFHGGFAGTVLAIILFARARGIRVLTIAPGIVETPMLATVSEEFREGLAAGVPFPKRLARPDEYARLAMSLVEQDYLNGEVVRMDGALRMAPR